MELSLVPYGHIVEVIPPLLRHFKVCAELSRGRSSVDDIVRFVLTGRMHLWVVFDTEGIHGLIISEITQYQQARMLTMQYCSMDTGTLEVIEEKMHEVLQRFAQDNQCYGVEYIGRAGWRPTARRFGYTEESVLYQKFFEVPK